MPSRNFDLVQERVLCKERRVSKGSERFREFLSSFAFYRQTTFFRCRFIIYAHNKEKYTFIYYTVMYILGVGLPYPEKRGSPFISSYSKSYVYFWMFTSVSVTILHIYILYMCVYIYICVCVYIQCHCNVF